MSNSATKLLSGGSIITCDPALGNLERADILIENGRIAKIAPSIEAPGAEMIRADGHVIMPGLIDTHRHATDAVFSGCGCNLTFMSYLKKVPSHFFEGHHMERAARGAGRLALDAGVTTILDWCLSAHSFDAADAALTGYEQAGCRTVFAYGPGGGVLGQTPDLSKSPLLKDANRLNARCKASRLGLLELWIAGMGPEFTTFEIAQEEFELIRGLGLRASMHVGGASVGLHGKAGVCAEAGLFGPDLQFAHCCNLQEHEMKAMAAAGVAASVSPYVEATIGLGPNPFLRLRDAGVTTGLGTDSVAVTGQGLFAEARALLAVERSRVHSLALAEGRDPEDNDFLTGEEVVRALTIDAARSLGLDDRIGSITPCKYADLIAINKSRLGVPPLDLISSVILCAEPMAVETVMVAGVLRKRDGRLVDAEFQSVIDDLADVRRSAPLRFIDHTSASPL